MEEVIESLFVSAIVTIVCLQIMSSTLQLRKKKNPNGVIQAEM